MKIDQRILNYEIQKHLPKSPQNELEGTADKQLLNEQKAAGNDRSGQQDTVVHLSPALKEAQLVKETISSEPDVREDKVLALKERIESGKYKIDHEAVADKLVDSIIDEIS
ncbi:MAG: flagellar biosynthesis anti-sigma factor FlgM [Deltaproteobacteria bacterium]|nr:flagellar biosynthesis anti-sigma factor FlgM [Deltaproteobacteria bacterium]